MNRLVFVVLILAACSDTSSPSVQLIPTSFTVISGANQTDTVTRELKNQIAIRVLANGGTPVPGYPVTWTALDGGAVFTTVVNSGTDGVARQRWTLGKTAGVQRLVARALDPETGNVLVDDTITATAVPGFAAVIAWKWHTVDSLKPLWLFVDDTVAAEARYFDEHGNIASRCVDGLGYDRIQWTSTDSSKLLPIVTMRAGKVLALFSPADTTGGQGPSEQSVATDWYGSLACIAADTVPHHFFSFFLGRH